MGLTPNSEPFVVGFYSGDRCLPKVATSSVSILPALGGATCRQHRQRCQTFGIRSWSLRINRMRLEVRAHMH
jgi:hypothetical protein